MKKAFTLILALTVSAALLCGCRMSFRPSLGLSSFRYDHGEQYTAGGASLSGKVERVEIQWLSGNVTVSSHDENTVDFSEASNRRLTEDTTLHYLLDGTTLRLQFCRSGEWDLGGLEKDLTVLLPRDLMLNDLEIDSVSAGISVDSVCVEKLNLDSVSGDIRAENCAVTGEVQLDTTSGRIRAELTEALEEVDAGSVSGQIEITAPEIASVQADTTSGAVALSVTTAPRELDISTVSGAVTLCLPEQADFILDFDTVSGEFSSELPCTVRDKSYLCGRGDGKYEVDTTSGALRITVGTAE